MEHINTFGLLLDIVGVLLLWKFGLPEDIDRSGAIYRVTENSDKDEEKRAKFYDFMSVLALFFIVIGFFLQIVSNYPEEILLIRHVIASR